MSIDLLGARCLWPIFRIYEGGMGHLLVFIWIQVHYIHNAFTDLEFSNITIFDHKMCFKMLGKVQILKAPVRIELVTNTSVIRTLTN